MNESEIKPDLSNLAAWMSERFTAGRTVQALEVMQVITALKGRIDRLQDELGVATRRPLIAPHEPPRRYEPHR